jgi:lipoyl(octanoyl) transferase
MSKDAPLPLEVYLLGLVDLEDVLLLQSRLVYELGEGEIAAALILCEHPPVITVGRHGSRAHIVPDDVELKARKVPVRWVNRGGGCQLHLPGQLSAYLCVSLHATDLSVLDYLRGLDQALMGLLDEFGIRGATHPGFPGMFIGNARLATVGVAVKRWIAYHGMTINVGAYLEPFRMLDEPGPGGATLRQTSLEAQRQRPAPMPRVREALIGQVERTFGLAARHLYTSHPLVRRKARPNVHAQSLG